MIRNVWAAGGVALVAGLALGCDLTTKYDEGSGGSGGDEGGVSGNGGDGGSGVTGPCLERPSDLPRPPNGALPCDLRPPAK